MGIMDFLKKKERDTGFEGGSVLDNNSFNNQNESSSFQNNDYKNDFMNSNSASNMSSMNSSSMFGQAQQSMPPADLQKDLQVISLKLDSIKSELDAMNQRLKTIETIAESEQQKSKAKKWY